MADFEADFNLEEQPEIEAVFSIEVEVKKHNDLIDRDAENCHPMGAITGLTEAIESKQDVITDLNEIREGAALGATAVQSVESGTENGTISVDGADVSVTGLGSAAFTASTDYDVAGAASTAETNAKNYADGLASNYATAEQGQKADTAVQTIETGTTDGTISVDGTEVAVAGLGSAAYTASTDYATSAQGTLADSALQPTDVIDDTVSTDTDKPLSANMGKSLQDQVDNLKARGRFLALWNCATGLAQTNPPTGTYEYKTGDYFIIGTVATGGAPNYKPTGSSYTTGVASTVVETQAVDTDDVYYYDGTNWSLQINTQKTVSFGNIAGSPYDNSNLASALNDKQDSLIEGTGISIGSDNTISNSGVRSIATGASNGTISVNTNGTSAEVAVYGLGSAAYTSSTDYATSAQGTKADTAVQPGDLATVATSGLYSDLSGTPTIPTVNDATITITQGGVTKGSFTLNQSSAETIALDSGGGVSSLTDIAAAGTAIEFTNQHNDDYTVVGSPTISSGIASNFSAGNYVTANLEQISYTEAEFITKVIPSSFPYASNICGFANGQAISFNDSHKISLGYMYDGTTYFTTSQVIWIKLVYTTATSTYKLYTLIDNSYTLDTLPATSSWVLETTKIGNTNPFSTTVYLGVAGSGGSYPFQGSIDLNDTELLVDGAIAWRPIGYVSPITTINAKVMTGASSGTAGAVGLVPAPAAGDQAKFLQGDGTWVTAPSGLPSQTGQSGKYLTTDGSSASWANVDALPSQTGQSGKYLKTNGTTASWETVAGGSGTEVIIRRL